MDVGIDSGYSTQSVYDACGQWSQTSDSAITYPCGLRYPPEGGLRKPMIAGWLPLKGREGGARFTTKSGAIHPFGLSTAASMRTDVVQPILLFDSDHLRDLLFRLRKSETEYQWSTGVTQIDLDIAGAYTADYETYWRHLDSHTLKPIANRAGKIKYEWQKRNGKWPDHLHDCEIMQLAMVLLWGDLSDSTISKVVDKA
jgi:hypothetical protein